MVAPLEMLSSESSAAVDFTGLLSVRRILGRARGMKGESIPAVDARGLDPCLEWLPLQLREEGWKLGYQTQEELPLRNTVMYEE